MSDSSEPPAGAESQPSRGPSWGPFWPTPNGIFTVIGSLLVVLSLLADASGSMLISPIEVLFEPEQSTLRYGARYLEIAQAAESRSGWVQAALVPFLGTDPDKEQASDYTLATLEEVNGWVDFALPEMLAAQAMLQHWLGYEDDVPRTLAHLVLEDRALATALDMKFDGETVPPDAEADATHWMLEIWFYEWFLSYPDLPDLTEHEATQARVTRLAWVGGLSMGIELIGLALFVFWLLRGRPCVQLRDPPGLGGWSGSLGYAVVVRALLYEAIVITLAWYAWDWFELDYSDLVAMVIAALAALPGLWLMHDWLLRPQQSSLTAAFAFPLRRWRLLAGVTLAATGLDFIGGMLIQWVGEGLPDWGHWAAGIDEVVLWGSPFEVSAMTFDAVVWGPLVEEIVFRGLIYTTLRTRLEPMPAALISAGFFAAVHFYSPAGMLTVFWGGLVWALVYERTRSLLPGFVAHGLWNLLVTGLDIAAYR